MEQENPAPEADILAFPTEDQVRQELETENTGYAVELSETKDKLLRTLAEMENLRRRTAKEIEDARAYGITSFARDMLSVSDNLRRALEVITPEQREAAGMQGFIEGVEMTERELLKTLEKFGVKAINPLGEKFNPNHHQAMFEVPDNTNPPGTITQVMQTGYMIGERVLRPAMVGVAKPPPQG